MDVSIDHKQYKEEIESFKPENAAQLEEFRLKYLGSKGLIKQLFADFKSIPNEQKKEYGQIVNEIKQAAESKYIRFQGKAFIFCGKRRKKGRSVSSWLPYSMGLKTSSSDSEAKK